MSIRPESVFVTGGTGLIGRRLIAKLIADGRTVTVLSRKPLPPDAFPAPMRPVRSVVGDPTKPGPWAEAVAGCDAVVHLAGEPIMARRWSDKFLAEVRDSRVKATANLAQALAANPRRTDGTPKVFVSGSGVGCYGADTGDAILTEDSPLGTDSLAGICGEWEPAAIPAATAGVRVCHPRTGMVLDPAGGALPSLVRPFRFFVGGRIASGRQYASWIHHDDMANLLRFALDTPALVGPFNATAPNPVTNREFARLIGKVLRRPNWLPVPRFALRILLGRVAQVVAGGQRAIPVKAAAAGFRFQYESLEPALRQLLNRPAPETP